MPTKREQALALLAAQQELACPKCGAPLSVIGQGLGCDAGHRYDVSRQGTAHLVFGAAHGGVYDRELFLARRQVLERGLFAPALEVVAQALGQAQGLIVDAGCGEGWAMEQLLARMPGARLLGLDLAGEGVRMAGARIGGRALLAVADLARMPLLERSVGGILNFLSPANYGEFGRVLAPGGVAVKVVPGPEHLIELRRAAGLADREEGSQAEAGFVQHFANAQRQRVARRVAFTPADAPALAAMSPLAAHRRAALAEALATQSAPTVTADLVVLWGRAGA